MLFSDHPPKDQECHANYKWETMAACPNTSSPLIEDTPSRCRIFHPFKHSHYSLNYLRHSYQEDYTVKSNENPQNIYHIQPCGTSKFCQNEDICTSAGGGGKNNNVHKVDIALRFFLSLIDTTGGRLTVHAKCQEKCGNLNRK